MSGASKYIVVCDLEIHYMEWTDGHGIEGKPVIVMWHGLTRNCRDFDDVAIVMAHRGFRVIAPDTIGRGYSQWSSQPEAQYSVAFYAKQAAAFLDALNIQTCYWLGTSMGGLLAMHAATTTLKGRITKLILNDVGPRLNPVAIERIKQYATTFPAFARQSELESLFKAVYVPFGPITDVQFRRIAEASSRRLPDGRVTTNFDPQIMHMFVNTTTIATDCWDLYDALDMPVLVLRGATSDLLLPEDAEAMTQRGPKATLIQVEFCGHAPALTTEVQQQYVIDFFAH